MHTDLATGTLIDYGVARFENISSTLKYFDRVGVEAASDFLPSFSNQTTYIDFSTGETLPGFNPSGNLTASGVPIAQWPYLAWGKVLPDPVPSDLYSTFEDFLVKYSLQDIAFTLNLIWAGPNPLDIPLINVVGGTGLAEIRNSEPGGSVRIVGGNNQLYAQAIKFIRTEDLLFNSTVVFATRSTKGVELIVQGPEGSTTIRAKQLLVTIPPMMDTMSPFDIDSRESEVFGTFSAVGIWEATYKVPQLPLGISYVDATDYRPYNLTPTFGTFQLVPTAVDGLYTGWFNGKLSMTDDEAITASLKSVSDLIRFVTGSDAGPVPEIVAYKRVAPWRPSMNAEAVKNGTWAKMYDLQGYRNTWYNGVIFTPGGPQIWNYTETVLLPKILASLM